jgi:hypothetical protein
MRLSVLSFVLGMGLLAPSAAEAFCGFYVGGADAKLFNNATVVVLMREGTRTVLSMQNNYQGPPEGFAMVVPVPVVLQKENVKTLPRELFDKVDRLAAPRLVEYWEQDPCNPTPQVEWQPMQRGMVVVTDSEIRLGVRIEAKFVVGEYEVVILSANDSVGLDKWLRLQKYKIPAGAEPFLRPYVQGGMKFFVAKVNPAKVKFENGSAMLSPLRFHYDSESFNLPVRLGLVNSAGTQDLLVHIIANNQRFEVANYPNVTIPTNLDVAEGTAGNFGAFYAALFDKTLAKHRGGVVTEYVWPVTKCDPCPGPVGIGLTGGDLMSLGADALPSTAATMSPTVTYSRQPEVKPDQSAANFGSLIHGELTSRVTQCYRAAFESNRSIEADFDLSFSVDSAGSASGMSIKGGDLAPKLSACVTKSVTQVPWPKGAAGSGRATVTVPFKLVRTTSFTGENYVVTRLHARYTKEALGEDLVFRAAPPIWGGHERRDASGKLDHEAKPSQVNSFQGRYAIRHPWKGKVECASPVRGVWGPPPGQARIEAKPAADIAFAPRGGVNLLSFLKEDVPALGISLADTTTGAPSPEAPLFSEPDPQAKPAPKPAVTAAPPPPAPQAGGCAACAVMPSRSDVDNRGGGSTGVVAAISAAVLALFSGLRRSKRRR